MTITYVDDIDIRFDLNLLLDEVEQNEVILQYLRKTYSQMRCETIDIQEEITILNKRNRLLKKTIRASR